MSGGIKMSEDPEHYPYMTAELIQKRQYDYEVKLKARSSDLISLSGLRKCVIHESFLKLKNA